MEQNSSEMTQNRQKGVETGLSEPQAETQMDLSFLKQPEKPQETTVEIDLVKLEKHKAFEKIFEDAGILQILSAINSQEVSNTLKHGLAVDAVANRVTLAWGKSGFIMESDGIDTRYSLEDDVHEIKPTEDADYDFKAISFGLDQDSGTIVVRGSKRQTLNSADLADINKVRTTITDAYNSPQFMKQQASSW